PMADSADPADKPLDPAALLKEQVSERMKKRIAELRSKIAGLERELEDRLGAEATIALALEGEGGGTWYVNVKNGEAAIESTPASPPLLSIHQTVDAFRRGAAAGQSGLGGPGGNQELTKSRVQRMKALKGSVEFRMTEASGGDLSVVICFGGVEKPATPQTTISVKAADAKKMGTGELNPQVAFMQGALKISGDAAFAMQVGMAMM
ncbi:MAG: SCP2 sterol-binding domain-containing protein, partial [Candidatus Binatia bacterium]